MGKRMQRQEPPTPLPVAPPGLDGILVNGRDPAWAYRQRIRDANARRQSWQGWLERHPVRHVDEMDSAAREAS